MKAYAGLYCNDDLKKNQPVLQFLSAAHKPFTAPGMAFIPAFFCFLLP
jgi:hypothetical protein